MSRLLRCYPPAWRKRYGAELLAVLEAEAEGGRLPWRAKVNVVSAGLAQRVRSAGLAGDELPPESRVRAGVLLVLSAWAAFVVAGLAFAKTAEHWQAVTPRRDQGLAAVAYDAVVLAAGLGSLAVLAGILLAARPLVAFMQAGGWRQIRRPVLRALASSGATAAALSAVVTFWARHLTAAQRNGGDRLYMYVFLLVAAGIAGSIALWTQAAVVTAWRLALARATLRGETFLAGGVTLTMGAMTVAATTWWVAVAAAAPAFFGSALPLRLLGLTLAMVVATALASAGTVRAVRAASA
ncbi:MAG TPA: hypothetical protein VNC40_10575 [Gaiellaceae bacterium]|nr:hypothetical protein [Gaiellaceae bacterium]